ncbi:hypothetical protein [Bacillus cereus]|uniref:hypothetical protein n=1 Tax=Bacillus cereus group TaxID=86661 RepID=UPI001BA9A87A|nr:hypothetical protein [Bacillus cereus]MBR9658771.1 hypothetical protein [Bacillus cereus]
MEGNKVDSTLMIFGITIFGYGMACLYQMGYKDFYHLPYQMIEITPSTISIIVITIGSFMILGIINSLFLTTNTDLKGSLQKIFTKRNQGEMSPKNRNLLAGLPLLILLFLFLLDKLNVIKVFELNSKYLGMFILLILIFTIIKKYIPLSMTILVGFMGLMCYQVGFYKAMSQTEYLTIKGTDFVVIDYKGDKAIISKVDFKKKIIYPEYQFIKLESSKPNEQQFELKYTGILKMKD